MSEKKRAVLDLITSVFFFLGVLVLLIGGWEVGMMSYSIREAMPTIWGPPYYPMKMLVPIGAFLVLIQGISDVLKRIAVLVSKTE